MPIIGMTQEEILLATAEQVAAGKSSTARTSKLPGETSSEANARLTQAYKELLARPILTPELEAINAEVKFVRQGAGGVGEYVVVTPIGAKIPADDATQWSVGIIPANSKYVTGTTLGMFSMGDGTVTNVGEVPVTSINKAGEVSTRSFEGQDAYYTERVGTTGKTQAQLDAARGQETALQYNKDIATLLGGTVGADGKVTGVAGKTVTSITPNADGTTTITASDGTKTTVRTPPSTTTPVTTSPVTTRPTTVTTNVFTPSGGGSNLSQRIEQNRVTNKDGSITITYTDGSKSTISAGTNTANTIANTEKMAARQKASDKLTALFASYGLESLAPFINKRIMEDVSEEMLLVELYDQPEYKLRFPGIGSLRAKKRTITEDEYMKIERAMTQTARFFDLPKGFYDNPDDFGKLIGNEVSAKEYQDRLQVGQDLARATSPGIRTALQEFWNVGEGGITAYVLDPDRALALIQKQAKAAQFVGLGREKGFKLEGMTAAQAEQIAGTEAYSKLSALQMEQALGQAQRLRETQSRLTGIEGETYSEQEALKAVIEGSPEALLASQQRAQREGARFGGTSGLTGSSLRSTPLI
jgi:hypothetical protein